MARVGSVSVVTGGGGNTHQRGFYTLFAIWIGWIVLSLVVGYVYIVLGGGDGVAIMGRSVVGAGIDNDGDGMERARSSSNAGIGGGGGFVELGVLMAKLGVSILLLFCLVSVTIVGAS